MSHSNLRPVDDVTTPQLGEVAFSRKRRDDPFANFFADRPVLESVDSSGSIFLNPDPVLQDEGVALGLGLYDRIVADDAHMRGQWDRRVNAVVGLGYEIVEAGDQAEHMEDAAFARDVIAAIEKFDEARKQWMKHRLKGYSVAELVFETDGKSLFVRKVKIHDPRAFVFGYPAGELRLLQGADPRDSIVVDPRKFLVATSDADSWNPYGIGLGQTLYYLSLYKKHALQNWHTMSEKHSTPTMDVSYKAGVGINKDDALELGEQATTQQAIAHDDTITLTPLNTAIATNPDIHDKQIDRLNDEMSVCITGQVLSSAPRATGIGSGQTSLAQDVTQTVLDSDARDQESLINSIIRFVVLYNRGARAPNGYPKAVISTKSESDQTDDATTVDVLARAGTPIPVKYVQKKFGIPAPVDGEPVLEPPGTAVTSGATDAAPLAEDPATVAQFSEGMALFDEAGDRRVERENRSVVQRMIDGLMVRIDQLQRLLLGNALGKRPGTHSTHSHD